MRSAPPAGSASPLRADTPSRTRSARSRAPPARPGAAGPVLPLRELDEGDRERNSHLHRVLAAGGELLRPCGRLERSHVVPFELGVVGVRRLAECRAERLSVTERLAVDLGGELVDMPR